MIYLLSSATALHLNRKESARHLGTLEVQQFPVNHQQVAMLDGRRHHSKTGKTTALDVRGPLRPDGHHNSAYSKSFRTVSALGSDAGHRTTNEPAALIPAVRRDVASLDPQLPLFKVGTIEERMA